MSSLQGPQREAPSCPRAAKKSTRQAASLPCPVLKCTWVLAVLTESLWRAPELRLVIKKFCATSELTRIHGELEHRQRRTSHGLTQETNPIFDQLDSASLLF